MLWLFGPSPPEQLASPYSSPSHLAISAAFLNLFVLLLAFLPHVMPLPSRRHLAYVPPPPTDTPSPSSSSLRKRKSPADPQALSDPIAPPLYEPLTVRDEIADDDAVSACLISSSNSRAPAFIARVLLVSASHVHLHSIFIFRLFTDAALNQCQLLANNAQISCFPTSNTTIPQHEIACFVCTSLVTRSSCSFNSTDLLHSIQGIAGDLS